MYFSTEYEGEVVLDNDPVGEIIALGATDRATLQISAGFVESILDGAVEFGDTPPGPENPDELTPLEKELRKQTAVHEIGHQFLKAEVTRDGDTDPYHRNAPPNIMDGSGVLTANGDFYFHPTEIDRLRSLVASP